jgi:sodium/bile acid cotransporter 7
MRRRTRLIGDFLRRQWFLIGLTLSVGLGLLASRPLIVLAEVEWFRSILVMAVMFVMALPMQLQQFLQAVRQPGAASLAVAMNYLAMPLIAWPLSWAYSSETGVGILVVAVTPCTLASAAVWTRRAGGNDATALLVTILTNAVCFAVAPIWLWLMIDRGVDGLNGWQLVTRLAVLVLLPLGLAQLARVIRPIAIWSTGEKKRLGILAQSGILIMVTLGSAKLMPQIESSVGAKLGEWLLMGVGVLVLHLVVLYLGWLISGGFGFHRRERIAVAIAGSQKTLMVGLLLSIDLGVSILPMVTFHLGQLFVDTLIADRWARKQDATNE